MKEIKRGLSVLPTDLLRLIFERLTFIDLVRAGAVAKTWYGLSRSCLPHVLERPTPWLMSIPRSTSGAAVYMMNLEQIKRSYALRGLGQVRESWMAGCSNGWLVLLDRKANPYLLNPFTRTRIQLPRIEELKPGFIQRQRVEHGGDYIDGFAVNWGNGVSMLYASAEEVFNDLIAQAIVTVDNGNKVNGVFVRLPESISYWRRGDGRWISMNREEGYPKPCYILFEDNKLYVLNSSWNVEIWDCSNRAPQRKREIINSGPLLELSRRDMVIKINYMVRVGAGEFLVAVRFIQYPKNGNSIKASTESWELYKMRDQCQGEWERIQALEGKAVFLGENESVALPAEQVSGCNGNTIYYSHDHRIPKTNLGEHGDGGIFDLQTKSIEYVLCCHFFASVWIVPNLSE